MNRRLANLTAIGLLLTMLGFAGGGAAWLHAVVAHPARGACTPPNFCRDTPSAPAAPTQHDGPTTPANPADGRDRPSGPCPVCQLIAQVVRHQLPAAPAALPAEPCCATVDLTPGRALSRPVPLRLPARAPPA